jgi:hypothetical protein
MNMGPGPGLVTQFFLLGIPRILRKSIECRIGFPLKVNDFLGFFRCTKSQLFCDFSRFFFTRVFT